MLWGSVEGCESASAGSLRYWLASQWAAGLLGRKGVFFSEATYAIPKNSAQPCAFGALWVRRNSTGRPS